MNHHTTTPDGHDDSGRHVSDELPLLLLGEAERSTVRVVAVHLRACTDCRDDLVDAVVSHATLRSAARTAPDVATGGRLRHTRSDVPALLDAVAAGTPERQAVDLGPVFAQIRAEAAPASSAPASSGSATSPSHASAGHPAASVDSVDQPVDQLAARRARRTRRVLAAAAAVVVIGGGTAVATTTLSDRGRAVTVSAYGAGTVDASARVGDGWVKLDASSLHALPSDQYYEAWLVNAGATGVLALGPLGGDGTATFSVPTDVMSQYPTLQVTVQQNDGDPRPSQTSVLRATL